MSSDLKSNDLAHLEELCRDLLTTIKEDPAREGLLNTPTRFAKAMKDLTAGYHQDIQLIVNNAIFEESYSEMVIVKGIEFYSLCEHHLLPFFGHAHVAYIPRGKVIGLSKIPRIVNVYARRLQIQERLTDQIASTLDELLQPRGVAVVIESCHLCMMMRGIQVQGGRMVTNAMRGEFLDNARTRSEFMTIVGTAIQG